jgi:hypothetical protein
MGALTLARACDETPGFHPEWSVDTIVPRCTPANSLLCRRRNRHGCMHMPGNRSVWWCAKAMATTKSILNQPLVGHGGRGGVVYSVSTARLAARQGSGHACTRTCGVRWPGGHVCRNDRGSNLPVRDWLARARYTTLSMGGGCACSSARMAPGVWPGAYHSNAALPAASGAFSLCFTDRTW